MLVACCGCLQAAEPGSGTDPAPAMSPSGEPGPPTPTQGNPPPPSEPNPPATPEPEVVAEGHIRVLGPWTRAFRSVTVATGVEGVDGFFFASPPPGSRITTWTNGTGAHHGYDLDFYFRDAAGAFIDSYACATDAANEDCTVPERSVTGEATGVRGVELDVQVVWLDPPASAAAATSPSP